MIPYSTLVPFERLKVDAFLRTTIRSEDRRQNVLMGLLGLVCLGAAAALLTGIDQGEAYPAILGGGLLAILATLFASVLTERRQRGKAPRPRLVDGTTYLPAARGAITSIGALMVVVGLFGVVAGVLGLINGDALRGGLLIIVGIAAFALLPSTALKQSRRSGMSLTAEGFSRGDRRTDPVTPWESFSHALIAGPDSLRNDNRALAVRIAGAGIPDFYVVTRSLCLSLWELLDVLTFYADHPDARAELGTEGSLHRIEELTSWPADPTQVSGLDWFRTPKP